MKIIEDTFKHKKVSVILGAKKFLITALKNANGYMFSECIGGATMSEFDTAEKYVSSKLETL